MIINNKVALGLIIIILFQILSFLFYGQSLRYPFTGDDYHTIFESLQEKSGFGKIWFTRFAGWQQYYRPVWILTFRINYLLAGLNPYTYHFVNIVLHGLNCALIFFIVYLLLKGSIYISLCPSLFFMTHPINSIVVNWISARNELLCCFFILLTIVSYYCFLKPLSKRNIYLSFSLLTCFFAFATKEHSFILPLLILICDIWYSPLSPVKIRIKRILPFFIFFGLFFLFRYWVLKGGLPLEYSLLDYLHIFENILRAMKIIVFPIKAIVSHSAYVYFLLFPLVLISIFPVLFKDKKVIFSLLWSFIAFGSMYYFYAFPSYNIYLQTIGFCLFAPFIAEFYARLFFQNKKGLKKPALISTILVLLSMYTMLTIKRNVYAQRASIAADRVVKGVLKLYPQYPEGSTFYFINVPFLIAENIIYGGSEAVASALSLNYGLFHKRIPVYAFTFMSDTLKVENKIEVEIKDSKTLIVFSKEAYLSHWKAEFGSEYVSAEEIDCPNIATLKNFITAKKMRITLKEKAIKCPPKHFFYFSNGSIYELNNFGK